MDTAMTRDAENRRDEYRRMERAILWLDANAERRPSLAEVADVAGLSPAHFQRVFSRWAGTSPARFLAHAALVRAKRLLAEPRPLLDASWTAGLSGPGRLHDLFVRLEAMTPGEWRAGGAGITVTWGVHPSPFGTSVLAETERGVCALSFVEDEEGAQAAVAELHERWPAATVVEDAEATGRTIARIFAAGAEAAPLPVLVRGTNFQLRVWEALLRIPPGRAATYQEVAAAVGAPRAVRAVGSAVARNPVAYLIPCHRVIRKTGAFGEYRWGAARKRVLLAWEGARRASDGELEEAAGGTRMAATG